jgi:drug/metabolite transporter (DMT)-like permease
MVIRNNMVKGIFLTIVGGILWGLSGTSGQFLFENKEVSSEWLVSIRLLTAGIILLSATYLKKGNTIFYVFKEKQDVLKLLVLGIFGTFMCQYTYFTAISYSNAGTATVLQYLCPSLITIYVCFKEKRFPLLPETIAVLLALSGTVILATHGNFNTLQISEEALFYGLVSALALAIYTIQPRALLNKFGTLEITGWGMVIGGFIACIVFRPWKITGYIWDWQTFIGMAVIVIFGTIFSFTCYLEGVRLVGAVKGSLLSSIEPVSATVFSVVLLNVSFKKLDLLGFVLIISAIFVLTLGTKDK